MDANLGYLYENLVAQMLYSQGNRLFYYTFPVSGSNRNYEIDFLLSKGNKIVPIEVKSSGYKAHKSIDAFCEKFSRRIGARILIYTKDFAKDGYTTCLPVYYSGLLWYTDVWKIGRENEQRQLYKVTAHFHAGTTFMQYPFSSISYSSLYVMIYKSE